MSAKFSTDQKGAFMTAAAQAALKNLPNKWGLILIAAPLGEKVFNGGEFISNVERKECIDLIRDTADRIERNLAKRQ